MTDKENKIIVDGNEYDISDLDNKEIYILKQVQTLRKRIADARFDLDQLVAAENAFANTLVKSLQEDKESDLA